ncbi:response regulator [Sphingopyxis sp. PAMC25046]|uniref:response regulator n=1 Tax=Sphingopyxis sp. PAMC25046 TaxID=2565556 RepID=UPI001B34A073|nr:response regulator [Sphingopyxis sp. PAMC25046]
MPVENRLDCEILVVEDEWLVRLDLVEALEEVGARVAEAETAEDALDLMAGAMPRILVTDIRLAGVMDGWDLAEAYRGHYPEGGVIYASANVPIGARQVAGSVFFPKPVATAALIDACHAICSPKK